jgi:hypothetical protein
MDVRKHVDRDGGNVQHGWMIWEWPGISVEGVFHAVWRKPEGRLLDVSKKDDGESAILFAPESNRVFSGQRVYTIRMAIGHDPKIKEWISINDRFDRIMNQEMRNTPFGTEVVLHGVAADLRLRSTELALQILNSRAARRAQQSN